MSHSVKVVSTVRDLRQVTADWRSAGKTIALVPTMGALHSGHVSLVRQAKDQADKVVVSIFVNPTQFAPHEDLARYPRDEAGDLAKLTQAEADLVWSPSVEEMYPAGFSTNVKAGSAAADAGAGCRGSAVLAWARVSRVGSVHGCSTSVGRIRAPAESGIKPQPRSCPSTDRPDGEASPRCQGASPAPL